MITDNYDLIDSTIILMTAIGFILMTIISFIYKRRLKSISNIKVLKSEFRMSIFALVFVLILPLIMGSSNNYCFLYLMITPGIYFLLLLIFYIRRIVKQKEQEEKI